MILKRLTKPRRSMGVGARLLEVHRPQAGFLCKGGKNDFIFPPEGALPYPRDLRNVETHLLDTGHIALETHGEEIASRIEGFLRQNKLAH